jgi:Ca2+:H+ antiporter
VVLETSLIGSTIILTLFNMGGAFIWGGWKRRRQHFNQELARTMSSMLSISVFGLLIPTAFDKFSVTPESSLAGSSRGTSVILITVYLFYAMYEYTTKGDLGMEKEAPVPKFVRQPLSSSTPTGSASPSRIIRAIRHLNRDPQQDLHSPDESEEAKLSITTSIIVLIIGTTILAFNTQFMTDSISGIAQEDMGQAFIGMVLIPVLSNDITALQNAAQGKMNSAIQCALGRSLQITLLVIPGIVFLAWIMQRDWTLSFDGFYMAILFGSTLVVQAGIGNGNSNW